MLSLDGGLVCGSVTARLRGYLARDCVYTRVTMVVCKVFQRNVYSSTTDKPSVCLLYSLEWNYCVHLEYITLMLFPTSLLSV